MGAGLPDDGRILRDGISTTGGGVTAGIDFALTYAAEISGELESDVFPRCRSTHVDLNTASPGLIRAIQELVALDTK